MIQVFDNRLLNTRYSFNNPSHEFTSVSSWDGYRLSRFPSQELIRWSMRGSQMRSVNHRQVWDQNTQESESLSGLVSAPHTGDLPMSLLHLSCSHCKWDFSANDAGIFSFCVYEEVHTVSCLSNAFQHICVVITSVSECVNGTGKVAGSYQVSCYRAIHPAPFFGSPLREEIKLRSLDWGFGTSWDLPVATWWANGSFTAATILSVFEMPIG